MVNPHEIADAALQARARIRTIVRHTPVELLSAPGAQRPVWAKCENFQITGSFKIRGASNAIGHAAEEGIRTVVTASTGNHGAAVAYAARHFGVEATVFVPADASPAKLDGIRRWGATITSVDGDPINAELAAREAAGGAMPYVSPYNDATVVAGQGTIGIELLEDLDDVDTVVVAVGGGGLISGIGSVLKTHRPSRRVIAASAANSAVMHHSIAAGRVLDMASEATLSDGTAGGVEAGTLTFPLCQAVVDEWITVTEEEIAAAVRAHTRTHHQLIEGAAGVALAAAATAGEHEDLGTTVVVLCGANIDAATAAPLIA